MRLLRATWTDHQVEQFLGNILRAGVMLAAILVLAAGAFFLHRHGLDAPHYRVFRGEPSDLRHFSGIIQDSRNLQSRGWIQLGLLLLIATPVVRVAFSVLAFALKRDRLYVLTTLFVLALLLYSLTAKPL